MTDLYKTISKASYGEFRDRGSKFFAYAHPAYTEEDIRQILEAIQKEHPKSRHLCYAYRLGIDKTKFRANDDGEPSGTAGKPILGQIDSFGLSNVFIGVIRYFGGTKLGVSGLINAYRTAAKEALAIAEIIEKTEDEIHELTFDYSHMNDVMVILKQNHIRIISQEFEAIPIIQYAIRKADAERINTLLNKIQSTKIDFIRFQ